MPRPIEHFVIYEKPKDFPDKFVVRRFVIAGPEPAPDKEPWAVVDTLEAARKKVPWGQYRIERDPSDDPVIVESWI